MLRHDKQLWKWGTLKSAIKFMFAKDGFIRQHWPEYKKYYHEDFHPWDHDNRELLSKALNHQTAAGAPSV